LESKKFGWLLKIPNIFLLIAAFIGGIYASINHISGIGISTPIAIGIVLVLYAIGEYYHHKKEFY